MPIASETSRAQYAGNNSTVTAYVVPFYFLANADVIVLRTDAAGVETELDETTDYVLTGAGDDSGGEVVTVAAYPNTNLITIYRDPASTQSAEFQASGALPAATLTRGLDKLTMLVQAISEKLKRCFRVTNAQDELDAMTAADVSSTIPGYDSDGNAALYSSSDLRELLNLEGTVIDQSVATWADAAARALKVPDYTGQLGVQTDTGTPWRSTATTAGSWTQINLADLAGTISESQIAALAVSTGKIAADAVTYAKLQNVSATSRLLGRKTAAAGDAEECTLSEALDFIGSAAQGDILIRGAAGWERLAAGTAGQFLKTLGAAANPAWANGGKVAQVAIATTSTSASTGTNIGFDNTIPQSGEGAEFLTCSVTPTNASSTLIIEFKGWGDAAGNHLMAALFQDSAADALCAIDCSPTSNNGMPVVLRYVVSAASTSARTYKIRFGANSGTAYMLKLSATGDIFSTAKQATLTITEILP